MYTLISQYGSRSSRQDADRPHGVRVTVQGSFRVNPATFPDSYRSVLPSREDPAISLSPTAVGKRLVDGRCRK